jgi:putative transposase
LVTDLVADGLRFLRLTIRSRTALSAEVLFLRKQLAFYEERQTQPRRLSDSARFFLALLSRLFDWKDVLVIVKPETLIGWHRKGFKLFWRWKSQAVRPRLPENIRKLIVRMAEENPTWGQARVAAELSVKRGRTAPTPIKSPNPPQFQSVSQCPVSSLFTQIACRVLCFQASFRQAGQRPTQVP